MKRIFTLLALSAFLVSFTLPGLDDVVKALKVGNATQVARYFDQVVEITMPDKRNSYSKSQAEMILKDFFKNNPIKSFDIIHKGENAGAEYCIGTLVTRNATYRTTVFMKHKGTKQTLQEIRFENR